MNRSGQNFHFLLAVIFSKFLDGIKKEGSYAIDKVAHFHKFKHLWIYGPKAIQVIMLSRPCCGLSKNSLIHIGQKPMKRQYTKMSVFTANRHILSKSVSG